VAVAPDGLRNAVASVFEADGAPLPVADAVACVLVEADLADHPSHGVFRLTQYHRDCRSGHINPAAEPRISRDDGTTLTIDGNGAFGHIVARLAGDLALERARVHGVCAVAVHRCSHVGRLADHVGQIAAGGMIGMMTANDSGANPIVAPHRGSDGRLSTNPIAFGIPRAGMPHLVLDMATSTVSHGAQQLRARWGDPSPETHDALPLHPVGGHKGYGLALVVEVLAGILTGAGWSGPQPRPDHQGVFLVAIDPDRFCGRVALEAAVEDLISWVKASPLRDDAPVLVPGEASEAARRSATAIAIDPVTWRELLGVFAETNVDPPAHQPLRSRST
jgi:hydroxycarboxylate dehydrogenase B